MSRISKRVHGNDKKKFTLTLKSVQGRSIYHYFFFPNAEFFVVVVVVAVVEVLMTLYAQALDCRKCFLANVSEFGDLIHYNLTHFSPIFHLYTP